MNADPAILLDVTRLISRLDKGPATGIDRVEAEWLGYLSESDASHLLLARVWRGQLVLPSSAGKLILRWLSGDLGDLPEPRLIDRLRRRSDASARAEIALRDMALLRSGPTGRGISRFVLDHLGKDAAYLNVGHSNLNASLWSHLAPLCRVLLIHDTIPMDHPEFTRAGQSGRFRERFAAGVGHADLILSISEASRVDLLRWRDELKLPTRTPVVTTPIGTRITAPSARGLPAGLDLGRPFFLSIGTIEPRKNHALLLDAWQELTRRMPPARMPQLFIIGRRGWENHEVFARLDGLTPADGVHELSGLDDAAVAELFERCHGLLMPSRAEGFGLPLTEAAARGVPVICSPLPVARELLGDYAHYLSPDDHRAWAGAVSLLAGELPLRMAALPVPQWQAHFDLVNAALRERLHLKVVRDMPAKTVK
ncbi:glycosyltransferase family 4 protein [Paracoccus aestuariivivens]|uniref:Glycosyltransferase n=1 Tax=Paracoccus aestuariivivens TaxID=1820333 RepID=A0A6L6J4Z4_9RHOB|nr:glycosyltransferase family 1 protein [Paracoccus aestuariivivens]MTH76626.1 glycosyltransferase [Paracoccus aestuariivivens]